ncbi:hypothetical protein KFK09_017032 [Dendrobium nobile]|uniref:Uncharacterized protein n=1 Tax=Dendrobium nobile TaxID=94219 RepID=A0A8T3AZV0_DENNO|nr:hypothetical protein KFK09_017032 [Dendrobium nobile]
MEINLESKSFCLSISKIEYIEHDFSSFNGGIVTFGDQAINKSTRFRYLVSIVQSDGGLHQACCVKEKYPSNLKGKFYKKVVRLVMLYGTKCRPLKEKHK